MTCPAGSYFNETILRCICPTNAPYVYNNTCLPCRYPSYWNLSTQKCDTCASPLVYNVVAKRCDCPEDRPNLINGVCQGCQAPLFWNPAKKICDACPQGTHYLIDQQRCGQCPPDLPLWNGKYCVKCPLDTEFDPK